MAMYCLFKQAFARLEEQLDEPCLQIFTVLFILF